jgi:hypothetical protein
VKKNAAQLKTNPLELTGSTDKSGRGEKAVAVAAPIQLGYDDHGQEIARATAKSRHRAWDQRRG